MGNPWGNGQDSNLHFGDQPAHFQYATVSTTAPKWKRSLYGAVANRTPVETTLLYNMSTASERQSRTWRRPWEGLLPGTSLAHDTGRTALPQHQTS